MYKKLAALIAGVMTFSSVGAAERGMEDLDGYRCVSTGLRQPIAWRKSSEPRIFSRYRRKAMVDLKGKLKLIFPTYYMGRSDKKVITEFPFPNDVQIQAGIEPAYKMSNKDLGSSPRIVGNTVTYKKGDKDTYKIITVDLGKTVIKKGQWYGIWVALENLDGENMVPVSRVLGNTQTQIFEASGTSRKTSYIKDDYIRTVTEFTKMPLSKWWVIGFSPVAILAKTDYKGDVWAVFGSSIPEGWYDAKHNPYGDENGNLGYADKLISTRLGAPCVNLSKGSDRLMYCATELKGRFDIMKICGVTKVHLALGGNDVDGRSKVERMKNDSITISKKIKAFDPEIEVIGSTVTPRTISSDKFKTLKGQRATYQAGGVDCVRARWNDLLRKNPREVGLDGAYELCNYIEHDWKMSTSLWTDKHGGPDKLTKDGIHPNCIASEAIAKNAVLILPPKK